MSYISWVQAGKVWALRVPLFHVCLKSVYCSCICHGWLTQSAVCFWLFSGSPFFYGLPHLGAGLCLMVGFAFLHPTFFFLLPSLAMPFHHSCYEVVCLNPVGPLWACHLLFSQWLSTTIDSFITSLAGSCVPFVFSWASLAHLLFLGFLGPFLNFAFPWAFTEFFGFPWPNYIIPRPWGFMGLPSTPYFLYFGPVVAHSHFFTPYTAHGLLIFLFPGSFKPIYPLKAHLFISWAYDPLFLLFGPNRFFIHLPILLCSCCWAFPFHLDFQNGHQHPEVRRVDDVYDSLSRVLL